MWSIYLTDIGPNRGRVICLLRDELKLTLADAKKRADSHRALIAHGDQREIAMLRNAFRDVGASVEIVFYPEGIDPSKWIGAQNSLDKKTCLHCGGPLFYVIPGRTSEEDIVAYRSQAGLPLTIEGEKIRWMHPGVYCPSHCFEIFVDFGDPATIA